MNILLCIRNSTRIGKKLMIISSFIFNWWGCGISGCNVMVNILSGYPFSDPTTKFPLFERQGEPVPGDHSYLICTNCILSFEIALPLLDSIIYDPISSIRS
jgi:hypothetical protein